MVTEFDMGRNRIVKFLGMLLILSVLASGGFAEDKAKINLNSASVEELSKVPGLNLDLARKIVKLREDNGEFIDMEELLSVPGINNELLRKLKKHLFVESVDDCNC
jgi:competence ComEA-like helix-hairpin-helix protein